MKLHVPLPHTNPVILKELRGRMRGSRAFIVLTVYLLLMAGFTLTLYVLYIASLGVNVRGQSGFFGRTLFTAIVAIELFLIAFIVPAFTASAITGERERQTYDLLRTTLIRPGTIVVGKLISALSYTVLLILAAIPLQSLAFLFGGVSEIELFTSFAILLVTSFAIGSIGIYFSCTQLRTISASIATYGVTLVIMIGIPLLLVVILSVAAPYLSNLTATSAPASTQAAITCLVGLLLSTNPLATTFATQVILVGEGQSGIFMMTFSGGGSTLTLPLVAPWIVFSFIYVLFSLIVLRLAIRRLNKTDRRLAEDQS